MEKIRVLNVDDSAFMRKLLKDTLNTDSDFGEIVQARNGKEALEILENTDFDVVTLDIEMPVLDGIETLKQIMKKTPMPVVMISSATQKYAKITFDALEIGAVDFISKPKNIFTLNNDELNNIINVVKSAAWSNKKALFRKIDKSSKLTDSEDSNKILETRPIVKRKKKISKNIEMIDKMVVVGTSTGGPRALQAVLPNLDENIDVPILIVQHMPKGFTKSLAERLNSLSKIKVKEAEDGEIIKRGYAYIAPGGVHLKIKSVGIDKYKIYLDDCESINGHKPSVDALFDSVAKSPIDDIIAVVMTGMGSDGAKGIEKLKTQKKAVTLVEDESTCVVYGMPKAATETGKVDKVLPLNKISVELNKLMGV